ncbi:hypothetical protein [Selenomonas sp. AE3005]|uniref:hypothetical protein n=1 Tax=Selenomonas sp. AE3005 TaxID=1485543 RepID=UPI000486DF06|nr:hypothetical protein [Selenomonas sp. AE3005]
MAERLNRDILYSAIKKRWEKYNPMNSGVTFYKCKTDKMNSETREKYYLADVNDNFCYEMSSNLEEKFGGANEINGKMRALYSSSAMTYNIFTSKKISSDKVKVIKSVDGLESNIIYNLRFEEPLPALSTHAKLDACIESEDKSTIVFFEMKMREWLIGGPSSLPKTYMDANIPSQIKGLFEKYIKIKKENNKPVTIENDEKFKCSNDYFDVFQIIKHVLGIYNAIQNEKFPKGKKIRLVIGYWTIPDDLFDDKNPKQNKQKVKYGNIKKQMEAEIEDFIKNFNGIKKELFKEYDFKIERMTVKDIVDCLDKTEEEEEYLKRYI